LTIEEIEEFKLKNEQKKKESELNKKNKKLWQQLHGSKKKEWKPSEDQKTYPRPLDRDERKRLTREARENK
jgi:predicted transcriptional regulator